MEEAAVDLLSPPFLCWLSRDECPSHLALLVGARRGSLAGWALLPWYARAAVLSAGVLAVAASLLYWRRWRRGRDDGEKEETDSAARGGRASNAHTNQDSVTSHQYQQNHLSPPHTPRVTIIPSSYPHHSSPHRVVLVPSPFSSQEQDEQGIEGAEISFLDSDDDGEPEATPLAPPTNTRRTMIEFSLSYGGGSSSDEDQSEAEDEGTYSLTSQLEREAEEREIVSQTIITTL